MRLSLIVIKIIAVKIYKIVKFDNTAANPTCKFDSVALPQEYAALVGGQTITRFHGTASARNKYCNPPAGKLWLIFQTSPRNLMVFLLTPMICQKCARTFMIRVALLALVFVGIDGSVLFMSLERVRGTDVQNKVLCSAHRPYPHDPPCSNPPIMFISVRITIRVNTRKMVSVLRAPNLTSRRQNCRCLLFGGRNLSQSSAVNVVMIQRVPYGFYCYPSALLVPTIFSLQLDELGAQHVLESNFFAP